MKQYKISGLTFFISLMSVVPVFGTVTFVGSDLLGPVLQQRIEAFAGDEGIDVKIEFNGTYEAKQRMEEDGSGIALYAVPNESQFDVETYDYYPFAFQVSTVLVHRNNPLNELTYQQLGDIFRAGGRLSTWGGLISASEWQTRSINLAAMDYAESLAVEVFKAGVLPNNELKTSIRYFERSEDLVRAIADNNTLMALYPSIIESSLVKPLSVSSSSSVSAYAPTIDNIFFGDYPIRLPFYLVVKKGNQSEALHALLTYLYSEEVSEFLLENDWVPLPNSERARFVSQFQDR